MLKIIRKKSFVKHLVRCCCLFEQHLSVVTCMYNTETLTWNSWIHNRLLNCKKGGLNHLDLLLWFHSLKCVHVTARYESKMVLIDIEWKADRTLSHSPSVTTYSLMHLAGRDNSFHRSRSIFSSYTLIFFCVISSQWIKFETKNLNEHEFTIYSISWQEFWGNRS